MNIIWRLSYLISKQVKECNNIKHSYCCYFYHYAINLLWIHFFRRIPILWFSFVQENHELQIVYRMCVQWTKPISNIMFMPVVGYTLTTILLFTHRCISYIESGWSSQFCFYYVIIMHALGIYGKQYLNVSIYLCLGFVVIISKW